MKYFAKIVDSRVVQVIKAEPDFFKTFIDTTPGIWLETVKDGSIRGVFAGVGYTYDNENDVFVAPVVEVTNEN